MFTSERRVYKDPDVHMDSDCDAARYLGKGKKQNKAGKVASINLFLAVPGCKILSSTIAEMFSVFLAAASQ